MNQTGGQDTQKKIKGQFKFKSMQMLHFNTDTMDI